MTTLDLSKIVFPDVMDLRTAALYLGVSEMRIRTLARTPASGLKSGKDENGKWSFKKSDLDAYKSTPRVRKSTAGGVRGEGKAWIINVKHGDLEKVKAALKTFAVELQPRYNYAAMKEYQAKRNAAKKAGGIKIPAVATNVVPAPNRPAGK